MSTTIVAVPRLAGRVTGVVAGGLLVALVAACSGGGSTATTSTAASAAQPTGAPGASAGQGGNGQGGSGQGRPRVDQAQLQQIRQCLEAAGIAVPTFSPRAFPSGSRPSFSPGQRPSFSPGERPSFSPGQGGPGGFFQVLQEPAAKAALEACGIAVPSFGPRPSGAADGQPPGAPPSA